MNLEVLYLNLAKLKKIRKSRGFTQGQMAVLIGYKGKSSYCMLENGQVKMPLETAKKIADILNEDVKAIFFDDQVQACKTQTTA